MSTDADADVIWIDESGKDGQTSSVADMVAQAASSFMTEQFLQGYEYIDEYKMYYNRETGYYYQPETSLFYHAASKAFYRYDEATGGYVLHGRANPDHKWSQRKFRKRTATLFGEDYVHSLDQTGVDVAETVLDLVDRCAFLAGDLKVDQRAGKRSYAMMNRRMSDDEPEVLWEDKTPSEPVELATLDDEEEASDDSDVICCDDEEMRRREEEESSKNPPCIRVVEVNNGNALHMVTIMGATVGWGDGCDVRLAQTDHLAENHLRITYVTDDEDDEAFYKLECLSKRHPAWVGGSLLEKGSYCKLQHMDWLTIDNHCLVFHIHKGLNTCPQCEPGIQPKAAEPAESVHGAKRRSAEAERRRNNRLMKRQLGLYGNDTSASKDYADRAKERRTKYGSEPATQPPAAGANVAGIYANCAAAPVPGASLDSVQLRSVKAKESHEPVASSSKAIDANNVGFKLLKSMGWKEGSGLGKQQQGIVGPIISEMRADRSGLGASSSSGAAGTRPKVTLKLTKKEEVLLKTKQRYEEASRRTE